MQAQCIRTCYDSARGRTYLKGRSYEVNPAKSFVRDNFFIPSPEDGDEPEPDPAPARAKAGGKAGSKKNAAAGTTPAGDGAPSYDHLSPGTGPAFDDEDDEDSDDGDEDDGAEGGAGD